MRLGREENWMMYLEEMTSSTHLSTVISVVGKSASRGGEKAERLCRSGGTVGVQLSNVPSNTGFKDRRGWNMNSC